MPTLTTTVTSAQASGITTTVTTTEATPDPAPIANAGASPIPTAGEATTDGALTLTYFDGAGRAELTRLALAAGGIEYVDTRLSFADFGSMKADPASIPMQRFGSVPLLQHGDDFLIAQSQATATYAASLGISAECTPKQRAVDSQYAGVHADIQGVMYKVLFGTDESKEAGKEALPASAKKFLDALETMVPAEGFINGLAGPTLADLALFDVATSPFPGLRTLGVDVSDATYPKLNGLLERVGAFPSVAAYSLKRGF